MSICMLRTSADPLACRSNDLLRLQMLCRLDAVALILVRRHAAEAESDLFDTPEMLPVEMKPKMLLDPD